VQVDEEDARGNIAAANRRGKRSVTTEIRNWIVLCIAIPPMFRLFVGRTEFSEFVKPVICEI